MIDLAVDGGWSLARINNLFPLKIEIYRAISVVEVTGYEVADHLSLNNIFFRTKRLRLVTTMLQTGDWRKSWKKLVEYE